LSPRRKANTKKRGNIRRRRSRKNKRSTEMYVTKRMGFEGIAEAKKRAKGGEGRAKKNGD